MNKSGRGFLWLFLMLFALIGLGVIMLFIMPKTPHASGMLPNNNVVVTPDNSYRGSSGGGVSVPAPYIVASPVSPIVLSNIRIDFVSPDSFDLNLSWNVDNGVGCCGSFGCDFDKFRDACLVPFRLYDLYFDGVKEDIVYGKDYSYTCTPVVPYNYYVFENVAVGEHIIRLEQRDCDIVPRFVQNISFVLTSRHTLVIV